MYPLKLMYLGSPGSDETKAMFVVPKRNFRKAHDRNKLKRRTKEAYRLNKSEFYSKLNGKIIHLAFIYTGKKAENYDIIKTAVISLLEKVVLKA